MSLEKTSYDQLITQIGNLLQSGRKQASQAVNTILVQTYWHIGQHIVVFEQKGNERAEYGSQLFERLSKDLTLLYGKGFSRSNLLYMRKLYQCFPISETLSHLLTWSHYFEILKADNPLEISFYIKQCEHEKWSVRDLKRQMKSCLFERLALSKDKEAEEKELIGKVWTEKSGNLFLMAWKKDDQDRDINQQIMRCLKNVRK